MKHYLLQFFAYAHLPDRLQQVSRPFGDLAAQLCNILPDNPEKSTALRKLLEAKDCAVRAILYKDQSGWIQPVTEKPECESKS